MTEEDEAFDEIARKQGMWGGGYQAKRKMAADKLQETNITRPCRSCNGTGDRDTGIPESPIATCKPCNGTGQIALAQPAQRPWVGLTDEDRKAALLTAYKEWECEEFLLCAREDYLLIEQALKEKNNGT